jgi:uncharacterized LabA/DUF88 family protein
VVNRKVFVAIDSDNVLYAVPHGWAADFMALLRLGRQLGVVVESAVYASRCNGPEKDCEQSIELKRMGFSRLVHRPLRNRPDGKRKSDVDVALALDVWEAALRGSMDTLILISGDSDFIPLVERLVIHGVEVYVVGPDTAMAKELGVAATQFCYASEVAGLLYECAPGFVTPGCEISQAA